MAAAEKKTKTKPARSLVAAALKKAAAFYLFRYGFSVTYELGIMPWGSRRADIVANKVSGKIVILEVKSSLADFRADKKWKSYLDYCDKFMFCTTEDVYEKIRDELPKEVGVICLSPTTGWAYMAKKSPNLELSDENRLSVLARLAYRNGDLSRRTTRARQRVFLDGTDHKPSDAVAEIKKRKVAKKSMAKARKKYTRRRVRDQEAGKRLTKALSSLLGTRL